MSDENLETGLSEAESAYFESGGAAPLEPPKEQAKEGPEEQPQEGAEQPEGDRDEKGRFKSKTIPFDVFHAEREEHKRTKSEMAELRDFKARMEERWRLLENAAAQQATPEEQPVPDPEKDIFGYAKWQAEQIKALKDRIEGGEKATREQQEAQQVETAIISHWKESAAQEKASNPEFGDAVLWLAGQRENQLAALGKFHPQFRTPEGIRAQIDREVRDITIMAKQQGVSPARMVFELAQSWGYKGKAPNPADVKLPDQLVNVQKAQDASRTVGAASGSAGGQELTLEQVLAMPMPEFNSWIGDPKNARRYDKLMGA